MKKFFKDFVKRINWVTWIFYFVILNIFSIYMSSSLDIILIINGMLVLFLVGAYFTSKHESQILLRKVEKVQDDILSEIVRHDYYVKVISNKKSNDEITSEKYNELLEVERYQLFNIILDIIKKNK